MIFTVIISDRVMINKSSFFFTLKSDNLNLHLGFSSRPAYLHLHPPEIFSEQLPPLPERPPHQHTLACCKTQK